MKNSESYFKTVTDFQKKMAEITNEYTTTMTRATQYRGSEAYRKIETDAASKRDADILALKKETWPRFQSVISDMRMAATNRPMTMPTSEQANLLSVLKMRSTLTADELRQAENVLAGCPVCLSVLDDLAKQHGIIRTVMRREMSTADTIQYINNLLHAAQRLLSGEGARFERTPQSLSDCISTFGAFPLSVSQDYTGIQRTSTDTETVCAFCEIVNREDD